MLSQLQLLLLKVIKLCNCMHKNRSCVTPSITSETGKRKKSVQCYKHNKINILRRYYYTYFKKITQNLLHRNWNNALYDLEFEDSIFNNTAKHILPSNVATEGTGPKSSNSSCSGSEGSGAMRSSYFTSSSWVSQISCFKSVILIKSFNKQRWQQMLQMTVLTLLGPKSKNWIIIFK
jgi:hypothetical protein